MTLEEIAFFTEQLNNLKQEIKGDIASLRSHIDKEITSHASDLWDHEQRLTKIENFNWRLSVITIGAVAVVQLIVNVVIELVKT